MSLLYKEILWFIFSVIIFMLGVFLSYLKLFKKDSWLYKESEGIDWLYDTDGIRTWGIIFALICVGLGGILGIIKKIILMMQ